MSICVGLSLNFTPHLQHLPGVLLLAGRVLTLTPHSQLHTWITAVSGAERRRWNSLPRLHLFLSSLSFPPLVFTFYTSSLTLYSIFWLSVPLYLTSLFDFSPCILMWVCCRLNCNSFFFFFWLSSAFLIWEERGGIRPEKGKGRGEERDYPSRFALVNSLKLRSDDAGSYLNRMRERMRKSK